MSDASRDMEVAHGHLNSGCDPEHLSSAQMLRRHAQDLIEAAERLLAQAEAELEMAYDMVSSGAACRPATVENASS